MADTANQVLALNHMPNVTVVHKDARYLSRDDMKQQADLLVFEVSAGLQSLYLENCGWY